MSDNYNENNEYKPDFVISEDNKPANNPDFVVSEDNKPSNPYVYNAYEEKPKKKRKFLKFLGFTALALAFTMVGGAIGAIKKRYPLLKL